MRTVQAFSLYFGPTFYFSLNQIFIYFVNKSLVIIKPGWLISLSTLHVITSVYFNQYRYFDIYRRLRLDFRRSLGLPRQRARAHFPNSGLWSRLTPSTRKNCYFFLLGANWSSADNFGVSQTSWGGMSPLRVLGSKRWRTGKRISFFLY